MKKVKTILAMVFLTVFTITATAQPSPPDSPEGNPVPVGHLAVLLLFIGGFFLMGKRIKKE